MRNESACIHAAMNAKTRRLINLQRPMMLERIRIETNNERTNSEVATIIPLKKSIGMGPRGSSTSAEDSHGPAVNHDTMD